MARNWERLRPINWVQRSQSQRVRSPWSQWSQRQRGTNRRRKEREKSKLKNFQIYLHLTPTPPAFTFIHLQFYFTVIISVIFLVIFIIITIVFVIFVITMIAIMIVTEIYIAPLYCVTTSVNLSASYYHATLLYSGMITGVFSLHLPMIIEMVLMPI